MRKVPEPHKRDGREPKRRQGRDKGEPERPRTECLGICVDTLEGVSYGLGSVQAEIVLRCGYH